MIDVSELVSDPDLGGQAFVIERSQGTGSFQLGGYKKVPITISGYGVIQPATPEDLKMVEPGDRVTGMIAIWSHTPIYHTGPNGVSDIIIWNCQKYRVMSVNPWGDGGFVHATCARISGE
jgi:hypothetical protein